MKAIPNSYPIIREAKVISTSDQEKLGRIQLKVYPELSDIPDGDCPWCFPHTGGVHGKSFGVPLIGQLITCIVWSKYWNEITFLPFNITKPTEHIFDIWMKNQRPEISDMKNDPEEEHLVVEQFEDDFTIFHDSKNSQHGFLHPTGTFFVVNKDGSIFTQLVKKLTFHNKDSDLVVEADSESGNVTLKVKGTLEHTIDKDWKITVFGKSNIKTTGDTNIEASGSINVKSSGPCKVESSSMTTVKGSSMVVVDAPILKFSGNKSMGQVIPSGSGVCCAIPVCPVTGLPHTG
jgi:hypothetical protein